MRKLRLMMMALVVACCHLAGVPAQGKVVVAYVTTWNSAIPDPAKVTHVNFAFGRINGSANGVTLASSADESRLQQIVALKQQNANLKVLLSIGGATEASSTWRTVVDNASNRASFAQDCMRIINAYNLDGVDIDWEYPNASDANFVSLIREIRSAIGSKLLTYASDPQGLFGNFAQTIQYFDFINVMAYDMGQCHSVLHPSSYLQSVGAAWYCTGEESASRHLAAGVPAGKLVFGMPFYAKDKNANTLTYQDFINQIINSGQYTIGYDETGCVGYALQGGSYVWCFDTPQSLSAKCDYIIQNGFLGGMYWELGQDDYSGSLASAVANKLIDDSGSGGGGGDVDPNTIPAAPAPTVASGNVKSIFSGAYSSITPNMFVGSWGQATAASNVYCSGDEAYQWTNFNYLGLQLTGDDSTVGVSDMETLHVDIYPLSSMSIGICPIALNPTDDSHTVTKQLTANQWNSFDIPLSDFGSLDFSKLGQFKFDGGSGQTLFVDNIYFYKSSGGGGGGNDDDIPAAPTPTKDASKVKSIFSGAYSSITPNMFVGSWGQATASSNVYCGGDEAYQWTNFNYLGLQLTGDDSTVGVSDMETLHIDIYPLSSMSINIYPIALNPTDDTHYVTKSLTANQWNSFDIPLSDFGSLDFSKLGQFKFDGGNGQTLYVDNIYFWTSGDGGQGGGEGGNDGDIPAAPTPTQDASKVKSIYSGQYTSPTLSVPEWAWQWLKTSDGGLTKETLDGDEALHLKTFNFASYEWSSAINASDMEYIHIDVYPVNASVITVHINGDESIFVGKSLTAGQWNSFDIPLTDFAGLSLNSVGSIKLTGANGADADGTKDLYVDNIYFWTSGDGGQGGDDSGDDDNIPAAPTPTQDASKVKSIYSNQYSDNNGAYYAQWWDGQAKFAEEELASGDKAWHISDFIFIGIEHNTIDVSNMEKLHLDIYPVNVNAGLSVFVIADGQEGYINVNATKGQWNQIDLSVADFKAKGIDLTKAAQIKITATDGANGAGTANFYLDNIYYWTSGDGGQGGGDDSGNDDDIPAAPTPTQDASKVKSIYSGQYTSPTLSVPEWAWQWLKTSDGGLTKEMLDGDEALHLKTFNFASYEWSSAINASDMEYIHIDVYPVDASDITVHINGDESVFVGKSLTAGQWNSFDIPLTDFAGLSLSSVGSIKLTGANGADADGTKDLYVDNIYFWTSGDGGQGGDDSGDDDNIPAAPTPTKDEAQVQSLLSDAYNDNNGAYYAQWWDGQAKFVEEELASGDKAWHISNFIFLGIEHNKIDASGMQALHLDIYPVGSDVTLSVFPINDGENEAYKQITATANQWNQIDITIADLKAAGLSMTQAMQIKLTGASGQNDTGSAEFYLDNIYYWNNTSTGVDRISVNGAIGSADVYSLDGRLVRRGATSLSGLQKGIYVVNGRKVVVR